MKAYYENRETVVSEVDHDYLTFPLEAKYKTDLNFMAHWHNEIEIILVCEGSLLMGINSGTRVLKKGDIAFCNSGDIHYFDSRDRSSKSIGIIFNPVIISNIAQFLQIIIENPFLDQAYFLQNGVSSDIVKKIRQCFYDIMAEMQMKNTHYEIVVKGILIELIGLLLRYMPLHDKNVGAGHSQGVKSKELIQLAIDYIERNCADDISLENVADYLGISLFYFSRLFNNLTGQPFKAYLNNLRIEKAFHMLLSTKRSITDIAYECGFNSIRTFNRVFKTEKGIAPSSFR